MSLSADYSLGSACDQSAVNNNQLAPAGYNNEPFVDWREENRVERRTVSENDA